MAKKKETQEQPEYPTVADIVHTICKGDIIRYVGEHPDCSFTAPEISQHFRDAGYNVANI